MSMNRWFSRAGLRAIHAHAVAVVPLEVSGRGFQYQISIGVIGVIERCLPYRHGGKSVGAGNQRKVTVGAVLKLHDVPDLVVLIRFRIRTSAGEIGAPG